MIVFVVPGLTNGGLVACVWPSSRCTLRALHTDPLRLRRGRHLSGQAPAVACSGRERDRFWWAIVLASGIPEPLIQVPERLTQVTLIVVGSSMATLDASL